MFLPHSGGEILDVGSLSIMSSNAMQEQATTVIKEVLQKREIKVLKILLFGSRRRGDFHPDSDWDFLVLVENDLSFHDKHDITIEIQRKLASLTATCRKFQL